MNRLAKPSLFFHPLPTSFPQATSYHHPHTTAHPPHTPYLMSHHPPLHITLHPTSHLTPILVHHLPPPRHTRCSSPLLCLTWHTPPRSAHLISHLTSYARTTPNIHPLHIPKQCHVSHTTPLPLTPILHCNPRLIPVPNPTPSISTAHIHTYTPVDPGSTPTPLPYSCTSQDHTHLTWMALSPLLACLIRDRRVVLAESGPGG